MPLAGFDGVEDDAFARILHGTAEEDKGKELAFGGSKSPPLVDVEDTKMSPLHVIFDFKGVLVGKEYFKVNHLLPLPFNLAQGLTLLSKSLVPRPILKEFLPRCLK